MKTLTRRRFLLGSGAAIVGGGALAVEGMVLEPNRLAVSRHTFGAPDSDVEPIRLAVVTDLHLKEISELHQRLADAVDDADADLVLMVGDSVDAAGGLPLLADFLELLPTSALRFATLGNWEHWSQVDLGALRRVYEAGDTRLLVNEAARLTDEVALFGTDDSLAGAPSLEGLPDDPATETLLLSHCPEFRDALGSRGANVAAVLSGHTHGGQVAIAGWAPILPPGSRGYRAGWYREGGGPDLFVSRGVGTSLIPVRLGCEPELALIDWYPRR